MKNLFEVFYSAISRKHGEALFNSLVKANPERLRPRLTFSKIVAFAVAAFVHLLTFLLIVLGIELLYVGWTNIFAIFGAFVCFVVAWFARPRFAPFPRDAVSRRDFPVLYEFADAVAESLGAKGFDAIVIEGEFDCGLEQVGLADEKILYIGLPLWKILSNEEKCALVSYALAHGINGDPMRHFFLRTAIFSLIVWHAVLMPERLWMPEAGLPGILIFPLNLLRFLLSFIPYFGAYVLSHLVWIDSQKAEYLADYLATKACGTEAMTSLLEKSFLRNRFLQILHKISLRDERRDLFEEFRQDVLALPASEKEKIRRSGKLEKSRLDATHPPTFFRIEFLKNHSAKSPAVFLTEDAAAQIDEEMFRIQRQIQNEITDKYRANLYY